MADRNPDIDNRTIESNTLYIGQGVNVKGDVSVPHVVVVDGTVEGSVTARAVWVGPSGAIKGTIAAAEAEIHGTISEKIEVKQLLIIRATGRVSGDVSYGELLLEKGAIITGTFSSIDLRSDQKGPKVEQLLGKSDRPMIFSRIEPGRPLNSAGVHAKLPAADYRTAS